MQFATLLACVETWLFKSCQQGAAYHQNVWVSTSIVSYSLSPAQHLDTIEKEAILRNELTRTNVKIPQAATVRCWWCLQSTRVATTISRVCSPYITFSWLQFFADPKNWQTLYREDQRVQEDHEYAQESLRPSESLHESAGCVRNGNVIGKKDFSVGIVPFTAQCVIPGNGDLHATVSHQCSVLN